MARPRGYRKRLTFWIQKILLLQIIPFDQSLIRKGVDDVDLWVRSMGGSVSNFLKDYLDPQIKVHSPYQSALLTHHIEPGAD